MDLSTTINNIRLNIRVAILIETPNGYIFEKDSTGFYFPIGGRIKTNESSIDAAKREVREELNYDISELEYVATLENFFTYKHEYFQEICIVHFHKTNKTEWPNEYYIIPESKFSDYNIKPNIISALVHNKEKKHYIL